ncbi:MAG TPA: Gfo/Idh/MocA family oxidoreductase, partial [Urbifossiella sp.]|nr:Gfo/Idh/MocA family oxidoreductase [Urbifossiella sp.]
MPRLPKPSRRRFLQQSTAAAGVAAAPGLAVPMVVQDRNANSKLGIAVIGCGGQGGGNPRLAAGERLVALVDVDDTKLGEAILSVGAKANRVPTFHDYRRMYDAHARDLDAVFIATPDHHHAPAAVRAIRLGKGVFCEKPLTWSLQEARILATEAKRMKVHTSMGNQGHAGDGYRRLCEYVWAGAIGDVTETHSLMTRNFGGTGGRPKGSRVPPDLHWDEWLGPVAYRDYHSGLHTFGWRSWVQFGTGTLGDMGCHILDGTFWALKLGEAKTFTIECVSQQPGSAEMFARENHIRWTFGPRAGMPAVTVNSYDNTWPQRIKDLEQQHGEKFGGGTVYIGIRGIMATDTYGGNPRLVPKTAHAAFPAPPQAIPRSRGGVKGDLIAALKGGLAPSSSFDYAGPFTEFVLTGVMASRIGAGKKITWDVEKQTADLPEAQALVRREYRAGWEV